MIGTFCSILLQSLWDHRIEEKNKMHALTELIKSDMKPALGVTEPGAIAFAVSTAKAPYKRHCKKGGFKIKQRYV